MSRERASDELSPNATTSMPGGREAIDAPIDALAGDAASENPEPQQDPRANAPRSQLVQV
jgi:hypothetical protein